jgi:hypothetical protein
MGIKLAVESKVNLKQFKEMRPGDLGVMVSGGAIGNLVFKLDPRTYVNLSSGGLWRCETGVPMENWVVEVLPAGTELVIN